MLVQGHGKSLFREVTTAGGSVFVCVNAHGNLTLALAHATNGAFGELDNHEDVQGGHATGSFADGFFLDPASSQHGMDAIIYRLSSDGVPEAVYAADTMPSDGITYGRGENGERGGYSHVQGVANFEHAGDSSSIVAVGWFRGNLTCPMGAAGDTTILTNRKESLDYDAFVIKINGATMQGEWAVAVGQGLDGVVRNSGRAVRTTASGDVLVVTERSDSSDPFGRFRARLHKLDGATGATIWMIEYPGLRARSYTLESIGDDAFLGGEVQDAANGTDVFSTGDLAALPSGGSESAPVVARVAADGSTVWVKSFGQGSTRGLARSIDGVHVYAMGSNEIAVTDGACTLTGASGGFLVKLSASDGACVWAKDMPVDGGHLRKPVVDAAHIYAVWYAETHDHDDDSRYGVDRTRRDSNDVFLGRWSADDGTGEYVAHFGGSGRDDIGGMALGPSGQIVLAGTTDSDRIDFNGIAAKNLQHQRAEAITNDTAPLRSGQRAGFVAALSEATPSCLECSSSILDAAIANGTCFVDGACMASGEVSQHAECFVCDAATSQTVEQPDVSSAACRPPSPSLPPSPAFPPSPPSPPVAPGSQYAINLEELITLLSDATIDRIVLAPGTYLLDEQLNITRSVTLEAAVHGTVVLDAQGALPGAYRNGCKQIMEDNPGLFPGTCSRVLHINPPSATDDVELIGLTITGGNGQGAAAYIEQGQVAFSQCNIYDCHVSVSNQGGSGIVFAASGDIAFNRCTWYRTALDTTVYDICSGSAWRCLRGFDDADAPIALAAGMNLVMTHCSILHHGALVMYGGHLSMSSTKLSKLTINSGRADVSNTEISSNKLLSAVTLTSAAEGINSCDACPAAAGPDACGCGVCGSFGGCSFSCTAAPTARPPRYACFLAPSVLPNKWWSFGTEASFNNCSIHDNENDDINADGGGMLIQGSNTIASLDGCRIHSNRAKFNGGGLSVQDGAKVTLSRTIIRDNVATSFGAANIDIQGGRVYYQLPTPPGHWLPSTMCTARREPCDEDAGGDICRATPCSTTSGTAANSWTPSNCKAPLAAQPCEWQTAACAAGSSRCMLGRTVAHIAASVDINLPYECSSGFVGSNESVHQGTSICAGACPASFYCPTAKTLQPILCPAGYYCPVSTVNAIACAKGTFGATPGLSQASDCTAVSPGYWASPGSAAPTACGGAPFFCAGTGSAQPLVVDVGYMSTPESASPTLRTGQAPCPAGAWCSAGIRIACEKGYFADSLPPEQRTSQATCLSCPAFSTTATQGSASITQCLVEYMAFEPEADCHVPCELIPKPCSVAVQRGLLHETV